MGGECCGRCFAQPPWQRERIGNNVRQGHEGCGFPTAVGPNEDVDMLIKLERHIVERPDIGHVQVSNWHSQISRDCFPQPHDQITSDGAGSVAYFSLGHWWQSQRSQVKDSLQFWVWATRDAR